MANYDLHILQPSEFEEITRDLLQKKWNCFIESFTSGRDGGIDLRYTTQNGGKAIIQAKRYKNYNQLLGNLKKEFIKVQAINPERYYVSTSVGLTPANKDEIKQLFEPYIKDVEDIFGNDDLNNLLGQFGDVEKQYYKLWLSSTNVLENIFNKAPIIWSHIELEEIKSNISTYVMNDSFDKAKRILKDHKYVIISGIPGIGKTTLARMLVYDYLAHGYDDFINISGSIDSAASMLKNDRKQVFFFDDFLGASVFEDFGTGFAQKLLSFIRYIKTDNSKVFILTTREYILAEARTHYEKMRTENIEMAKCILDVGAYTKTVKAKMLYNHVSNAQLPQTYIDQFLKDRNYLWIINHHNYNPRVIESYIDKGLWKDVSPNNFMAKFKDLLSNPFLVWELAFEKLSKESQYALLILATMGEQSTLNDWRIAYNNFCIMSLPIVFLSFDDNTWNKIVKVLHDCFIKTDKQNSIIWATPYNASIRDYLINYLGQNQQTQQLLIKSAYFPEQITYAFTEEESYNYRLPGYFRHNYSAISKDNIECLLERFIYFINNEPQSCKLIKSFDGVRMQKFDKVIFIKQFSDCFPLAFRQIYPKIKEKVLNMVTNGNINNFNARISLLSKMNLEENSESLSSILYKLSNEDIMIEDYEQFIDLLISLKHEKIIANESFISNLEEAMIVDMDSCINNVAEYEQRIEVYNDISIKLPDGISLHRAFEHLDEISASFPDDSEQYDEDYYREANYSSNLEENEIDNMMQSLRQ